VCVSQSILWPQEEYYITLYVNFWDKLFTSPPLTLFAVILTTATLIGKICVKLLVITPGAQVFIDTVQDLFMFQHILKPPRYRGEDTPHVLDLVFTDDKNMVDNWLTYFTGLGNSDHVCTAFDLVLLATSHVIDSEDSTKYNMCSTDSDDMRSLLSAVNWESDTSVNDCWNYFSKTFDGISTIDFFYSSTSQPPLSCKYSYTFVVSKGHTTLHWD